MTSLVEPSDIKIIFKVINNLFDCSNFKKKTLPMSDQFWFCFTVFKNCGHANLGRGLCFTTQDILFCWCSGNMILPLLWQLLGNYVVIVIKIMVSY